MFEDGIDRFKLSYECEKAFEWKQWPELIPFIRWPQEVEVKATPPFGGAVVRYNVKLRDVDKKIAFVSVYLDCYGLMGYMSAPYWEIYPSIGGDTLRFWLSEPVEEMVDAIVESLKWQCAEYERKR